MSIIYLLTDFGTQDQYVSQMKSVIKVISSKSEVIDVTHDIPKFSIQDGAFVLAQAAKYFPDGSIAVAVVDPGVGTERKCIAVKTSHAYFVGPDNGLLYEAARMKGILEIREIASNSVVLRRGGTFDGRDVFAPAAAHLAEGYRFSRLGRKISKVIQLSFPTPKVSDSSLSLYVLHVDSFGNAVLNITGPSFRSWSRGAKKFRLKAKGEEISAVLTKSYQGLSGPGLILGSSGLMEVSTNRGGRAITALATGAEVEVTFA